MKDCNFIARTDGSGLWSSRHAPVRVVGYELAYCDGAGEFGELRVYFDEDTWDVLEWGLIYTDELFLANVEEFLTSRGYSLNEGDITYSEQGMQGDDYVSFDVQGDCVQQLLTDVVADESVVTMH